MIKHKHINPCESKIRANKVKYRMADGLYKTTHGVNVPFFMPEFYSSKIITHDFHVYNAWGGEGFGCDVIVGHYLLVQLGLKSDFGRQILERENTVVPMKEPGNFLGQSDSTKRDMQEVVIQTVEPDSTIEATEILLSILGSTYSKADLDKVSAAAFHLDKYQRKFYQFF